MMAVFNMHGTVTHVQYKFILDTEISPIIGPFEDNGDCAYMAQMAATLSGCSAYIYGYTDLISADYIESIEP